MIAEEMKKKVEALGEVYGGRFMLKGEIWDGMENLDLNKLIYSGFSESYGVHGETSPNLDVAVTNLITRIAEVIVIRKERTEEEPRDATSF